MTQPEAISENAPAPASAASDSDAAAAAAAAAPADAEPAESLARELIGGLVAAAIALACFLPPLLHFVTAPLGPAIGGFIVAQKVKPGPRAVAVIAATLGITLAALLGGVALAIVNFSDSGKPPDWFPPMDLLGMILGGVALYAAGLGALGTAFGQRWQAQHKAPPAQSA